MGRIKRSQVKTFINIKPSGTADYALLGEGITNLSVNYNPQVSEEQYIHEDTGTSEIESYRPSIPIEMKAIEDDEAFEFLDDIRQARAVLDAAKTDIVNVWLYEGGTMGEYPAEKQEVAVQVDEFGGEGGTSLNFNVTLLYVGDPVLGTFNPTTAVFTPNP